jgi:transcriptional regulator with XRE-family HTH domain
MEKGAAGTGLYRRGRLSGAASLQGVARIRLQFAEGALSVRIYGGTKEDRMRDARDIEVDEHVGARVRSLRLMRSVTQERLAEIAGVTFQQIQKYEKGVNRLSPGKLVTIGEALGVTPQYFFDGLPSGNSADPIPADIRDFVTSRDGVAIIRAFQSLPPAKRTALIRLIEAIAARESLP